MSMTIFRLNLSLNLLFVEKLSTNFRSEYASEFCHDRKSVLRRIFPDNFSLLSPLQRVLAVWFKIFN